MSPSPRKFAASAIPVVSLLAVAACGSTIAASRSAYVPSSSATPVVLESAAAPAHGRAAAAPAAGGAASKTGPGTVTITVTKPVSESAVIHSTLRCTQAGKRYIVRTRGLVLLGARAPWEVLVPAYHGPGSYHDAAVAFTVARPIGGRGVVKTGSRFAATITSAGGTLTIHRTGRKGRVLDETVSWTCP